MQKFLMPSSTKFDPGLSLIQAAASSPYFSSGIPNA